MKKFKIYVKETWIQPFIVEAENKEDALERYNSIEGDPIDNELEYCETQDNEETWEIEEIKE